ncbi:Flagellin FlgL [Devosia lucknowensis]|uniref:Flagellin n=1 Tax=Devosia lucknowensis TaxID=1096929 RepID=A0A1Y6EZQ1_9HYPH|nr:flagellin [Devosia lucknowensis]SMQ66530.1 Flagellin FlgL [Devosia lucknowensis]
MADISLSKAVRSNLLSLKGTADMMASTQNRLATGNKVNSALDNPSSWFTAKGLTNRASDLGSLLDSMANGVKTLQAADNGLSAMTKTLESMQSTLRQARQDKSFQTASYSIGANATGNLTFAGGALDEASSISLTKAQPATVTSGSDFALAGSVGGADFTFGTGLNFDEATDKMAFDVTIDGKTETVEITKAIADAATTGNDGNISTADEMVDAMKAAFVAAGHEAASFKITNTAGVIKVESASSGSNSAVTLGTATYTNGGANDLVAAGSGWGSVAADNTAAATATITIGDGTNTTANIVLNGDDHNTPEKAAKAINDAIKTLNDSLAGTDDDLPFTASVKDGRLVITGAADGTGANPVIGGGGADAVFGTAAQRDTKLASTTGGATKTVDELVTEINSATLANGDVNPLKGAIRASNDNGKLRIENQSTSDLSVNGVNSLGVADGVTVADTLIKKIDGNSVRSGLADQFNELRDQLDKLADDASFNGINLLRGDKLAITFNETGTSSIDIQTKNGETINSSNLGVSTTLNKADLDSDAKIDEELGKLKSALNEVRSQASSFGSNLSIVENRQSFTKAMINTLEDGAGDLTLADMNTEAANLLALQTRQSLSQNSLSLASQADQSILQLIR